MIAMRCDGGFVGERGRTRVAMAEEAVSKRASEAARVED